MFQCIGQPLVDLSGRSSEAVLQRHRQTRANQLHPLLTFTQAGPGISLLAEDAGLQIHPLRSARLLCLPSPAG